MNLRYKLLTATVAKPQYFELFVAWIIQTKSGAMFSMQTYQQTYLFASQSFTWPANLKWSPQASSWNYLIGLLCLYKVTSFGLQQSHNPRQLDRFLKKLQNFDKVDIVNTNVSLCFKPIFLFDVCIGSTCNRFPAKRRPARKIESAYIPLPAFKVTGNDSVLDIFGIRNFSNS